MNCTRICWEYKSLPMILLDISDDTTVEINASDDFILLKSTVNDLEFVFPRSVVIPPIPAGISPVLEKYGNE